MFQKAVAGLFGALCLFASAAAADTALTPETAKRFVASLDAMETLGKEFEADGKTDKLKIDIEPKAGEPFKPFSTTVTALKTQYPADYAKLQTAVKSHGFSAEDWSVAGDQVMVAYVALKMEEENPQAMAQMHQMHAMDKSVLDQMPPEMKAQMTRAMAMMDAVHNVSAQDKAAVATVKKDLDTYMDKKAAEAGAMDHSGHDMDHSGHH
jgi:hypothetical protein